MAATHATGALITAGTSNAVGNTTTSTTLDNTAGYGAGITVVVTNGATGPTNPATVTIVTSNDGGTSWDFLASQSCLAAGGAVSVLVFDIPNWVSRSRVTVGGNTGQPVTITRCTYSQTTGI